jgi:hypothetical protein
MRQVLGWVIRAEEEAKLAADADGEAVERAVARAIERLAAIMSLPPVMVAVHMDILKRSGEF